MATTAYIKIWISPNCNPFKICATSSLNVRAANPPTVQMDRTTNPLLCCWIVHWLMLYIVSLYKTNKWCGIKGQTRNKRYIIQPKERQWWSGCKSTVNNWGWVVQLLQPPNHIQMLTMWIMIIHKNMLKCGCWDL